MCILLLVMHAGKSVCAAALQTYMQYRGRGWEQGRLSSDDGQQEAQLVAEIRETEVGLRLNCPTPCRDQPLCLLPASALKLTPNLIQRLVYDLLWRGQAALERIQFEADRARDAVMPAKERMVEAHNALIVRQQQKVCCCSRPLQPPLRPLARRWALAIH